MPVGPKAGHLLQVINYYNLDAYSDNREQAALAKFLIEHGMMDERMAEDYLLLFESDVQRAVDFFNPLHRLPSPEQLYGNSKPDIEIASPVGAPQMRVGIHLHPELPSILVAGTRGSGKTTLIRKILRECVHYNERCPERAIHFVIIDVKFDYIYLASELDDCVVLNLLDPDARLGLGAPYGVSPSAWINHVATMFSARAGMIAGWTSFAQLIRWALPLLNSESSATIKWPSLNLLLQVLKASPPDLWASKAQYQGTLIEKLEAATQSTDLYDCFVGFDADGALREGKHVLILVGDFEPGWLRRFTIDLILGQIFYARMYRNEKI